MQSDRERRAKEQNNIKRKRQVVLRGSLYIFGHCLNPPVSLSTLSITMFLLARRCDTNLFESFPLLKKKKGGHEKKKRGFIDNLDHEVFPWWEGLFFSLFFFFNKKMALVDHFRGGGNDGKEKIRTMLQSKEPVFFFLSF